MKTVNIVLVMALAGIVVAGCATSMKAALSPEEEIAAQLEAWRDAMTNKDIEGIMALFSEKFSHYDWQDKAGAKMFIEEAMNLGYLDDVTVLLDDAEIKVDGDVASVYPVDIEGSFGAISMELIVSRTNGTWLLTGMDAPGL